VWQYCQSTKDCFTKLRLDVEIHFKRYQRTLPMVITYDDFAKLEIRVAKIIATESIPGKTKIIKGTIDLGEETRSLIIGGAQYFTLQEMVGKTVIAITNLEPKTVGGVESNAMLLAADLDDKPYWLTVDESIPLGTKIK